MSTSPKKWIPKKGDKIYLLKANKPLNLVKNDYYGFIKSVESDHYVVENIMGTKRKFSFANQDDVFFRWFKNTPVEEKPKKPVMKSVIPTIKQVAEVIDDEDEAEEGKGD